MPLPMWAVGSAGASLLGGLMSGSSQPDWGKIGSKYMDQFGGAFRNQFGQNWNSGPMSGLTMGAGNAYDYANLATQKFKASPAYSAMMANLSNAANSTSQNFQQGLAGGLNTGVGQGLSALGNTNTMFNMGLMNANMQNYMGAQQQFNPLAQMRLSGAMDMTNGAANMAGRAMSQYRPDQSFWNRLGGGLQGLGGAGMQLGAMGYFGGGAPNPGASPWGWNPAQQANYWTGEGGTNNYSVRPR